VAALIIEYYYIRIFVSINAKAAARRSPLVVSLPGEPGGAKSPTEFDFRRARP
jgi:hypothetical protein